MAESTPRLGIPYPSNQQQPYFETVQAGALANDALHFGQVDETNTQMYGGGTLTWSGGSLSFTSDIIFISPTFGVLEVWSATESPVEIAVGSSLIASLTRGATTSVALTKTGGVPTILITSSVPVSVKSKVICYRATDGALYFPTGLVIADGAATSGGVRPSAVGASGDATYLTITPEAGLTSERQIAVTPNEITEIDNGPGNTYVLGLADTAVTPATYPKASVTVDAKGRITAAGNSFLVDTRVTPITTASAAGGGGTVEGTIAVSAPECELKYLRVKMNTTGQAEIRFFSDAARTDEIYKAPFTGAHDFQVNGDFIDRTPAVLMHTDGITGLQADSLYYRMTNTGALASTFNLHMLIEAL